MISCQNKLVLRPSLLLGFFLFSLLIFQVSCTNFGSFGNFSVTPAQYTSSSLPNGAFVQSVGPLSSNDIWALARQDNGGQNWLEIWNVAWGSSPGVAIFNATTTTPPSGVSCQRPSFGLSYITIGQYIYNFFVIQGGINSTGGYSDAEALYISFVNTAANNVTLENDPSGYAVPSFSNLPIAGASFASRLTVNTIDQYGYQNASLFVWGGQNGNGYSNSMYTMVMGAYNIAPTNWTILAPNNTAPDARADHASVVIGDNMYIFGGRNASGVFGDFWSYNFPSGKWSELLSGVTDFIPDDQLTPGSSDPGTALPKFPTPRYGASFVVVGQPNVFNNISTGIVMFGGYDGLNWLNDMWVYDPSSGYWEEVALNQSNIPGRAFHTLMQFSSTTGFLIYGGNGNATTFSDMWFIDYTATTTPNTPPSTKALPNYVIAGVAAGILLVLIITVVVLKAIQKTAAANQPPAKPKPDTKKADEAAQKQAEAIAKKEAELKKLQAELDQLKKQQK